MLNISYGIRDAIKKIILNDKDDGIEMLKAIKLRSVCVFYYYYVNGFLSFWRIYIVYGWGDHIAFHNYIHDL